jgi:hypothetical protein
MQEWKYYDFDEHWDEFLKVWKSESVQEDLDEVMEQWQEDNPTYTYTGDTHKLRTYERGDPLWEFGRTDYWACKISPDDDDETDIAARAFVKSLTNVHPGLIFRGATKPGRLVPERDMDLELNYYMLSNVPNELYEQQYKKNAPKPDSLESMIMMMGKNFIREPLLTSAYILFGDAELIKDVDGNSLILIPHEKIVFDLYNFYFITRDNDTNSSFVLQKDEYYDSKINDDDDDDDDDDYDDDYDDDES